MEPSRRFDLTKLIPLALVLAGVLAYINTLPNAFVFDDVPWILGNERITSLTHLGQMFTATNRPVLELTLAINYALGGEDPAGYHLTNLLIHVLAALALYGLVRRTLLLPNFVGRFHNAAPWLACAVSILWLLHPLNTQAVTYTIQRGESLMGLCYLFTLYGFLRFATAGATGGRIRWAIAGIAACWVGMGTKEVIATVPLVVLLYDLTFIAKSWREPFVRRWGVYLGLFAMWIPLAMMLRWGLSSEQVSAGLGLEAKMLSRWTYLLSQPQVITEVYLRKALWPNPLVLDYGWTPAIPEDTPPGAVAHLFTTNVLWQGALISGLFVASLWGVVRRAGWGFIGMSYFLILAPTSSLMPIADLAVEHRMYLPLIPVVLCVVLGADALLRSVIPAKAGVYGMTLVVIFSLVLGSLTMARNTAYHTRASIWDSVVLARPNNVRGWYNLGSALLDEGQQDLALQGYLKALEIMPNHAAAHYGIGTIWLEAGDLEKAIGYLNEAVRLDPKDAASHAHLGKARLFAGQYDQAEQSLREAIRLDQDYARAHEYLGLLFVARQNLDLAIESFRQAIDADPRLVTAYQNLCGALSQAGRPTEAADVADDVIRRAEELGLSEEMVRGFMDRRDRNRAQAVPTPASP